MFKRLLVMIIVGAAGFAAWNASHPTPVSADANNDTVAQADNTDSFTGRIKHKIGMMTVGAVGDQIRTSIAKTEHELALLRPAMKRTTGRSGKNAQLLSKKIIAIDSLSIASLDAGHPIQAVRQVMDARGYIDLIRQDVSDETAAR
jgi:hypothetical protein